MQVVKSHQLNMNQACPGVGDDIPHIALPFFDSPDFISSTPPDVPDNTPIDLVFIDFIEDAVLSSINSIGNGTNFTESDVQSYSPFLANQVLGLFAQQEWQTS